MFRNQRSSNGLSDPARVVHLQCSSCLPDHGMKEACVAQWSLGTLVPVSARVGVPVYWICLWRQVEKGKEEGSGKGVERGNSFYTVASVDDTPYCICGGRENYAASCVGLYKEIKPRKRLRYHHMT